MVTLKEVGEQAGVSASTVSLVLNGRDVGRITPEVAARVRKVAGDLGYAPNLLARGLRTRQTKTFGMVSDEVASTPFAGKMLAAAQRKAWDSGYLLLVVDTGASKAVEEAAIAALMQRNIEGLIYASMYHREVPLPATPPNLPLVILDGWTDADSSAEWIVPDEEGGARLAIETLIQAGHTRIGFCNSAEAVPASVGRLRGYRQALEAAGIDYEPGLVANARIATTAEGFPAAMSLLDRPDRPTALFCYNDRVAMGAYQAADQLGLRIPDDLSVIGFDNQEFIADSVRPGLTTVQLPHERMGAWGADRLIERTENPTVGPIEPPMRELAACSLIVRNSIAPPPAGD